MSGREFFNVVTVSDVLAGFRPSRRTNLESVPLEQALGRVVAIDVTATDALPGFPRATVDGFAVRAADTYGASEGLPSYFTLAGAVRMGTAPSVAVAPGTCVAIPTGAVIPDGADSVVMVEYTAETMQGTIEVTRPVAPGAGLVRADEDVAAGAVADSCRQTAAMRRSSGSWPRPGSPRSMCTPDPRWPSFRRATRWSRLRPAKLAAGQVRDATASALVGLTLEAGGDPVTAGIVADDRDASGAGAAPVSSDTPTWW